MNETREMSSNDPNNQNIARCMEMADYVFLNDGTINSLQNQLDQIMDDLL
jgi:dephospho-CoA kinase